MPWIAFEEREILLRESLHLLRKRIVALPERSERMGLHGKGRKFPASISIDLLQGRSVLAAGRKVLLQLLIPGELVLLCDISSKLRQFFTVQTSYRFLDL